MAGSMVAHTGRHGGREVCWELYIQMERQQEERATLGLTWAFETLSPTPGDTLLQQDCTYSNKVTILIIPLPLTSGDILSHTTTPIYLFSFEVGAMKYHGVVLRIK